MKTLTAVLVIILVFRWCCLENPVFSETVGANFRQGIFSLEYRSQAFILWRAGERHLRKKVSRFLAVGDSLVGAMFGSAPFSPGSGQVLTFGGMQTVDLFLNREYITELDPDYIILGLSEFSLSQYIRLEAIKHSPRLSFEDLLTLLRVLYPTRRFYRHRVPELVEAFLSLVFQEYRHQPQMKAIVHTAAGNRSAPLTMSAGPDPLPGKDFRIRLDFSMKRIIRSNLEFLDLFLDEVRRRNIRVIIVEPSIHPDRQNREDEKMIRFCRRQLEKRARTDSGILFISRPELPEMKEIFFGDRLHLNQTGRDIFLPAFDRILRARGWESPFPPETFL